MNNVQLMDRARFQQAVANAIDQHAQVLADLSEQGAATRNFLADLALRLDAVEATLRELQALYGHGHRRADEGR